MKKFSLKWRVILPIGIVLIVGITLMIVYIAQRFSAVATDLTDKGLVTQSYQKRFHKCLIVIKRHAIWKKAL